MSIVDRIKNEAKKNSASKSKFIYFRENEKKRIRFLSDMTDDEVHEIIFHDSFKEKINVPCQEIYGKSCDYCGNDDLRTRSLFAFSVYDYEAKEVKILMQAVSSFTLLSTIPAYYERYGTLLDRDYTIERKGSGTSTSYVMIPEDKAKFRDPKAKALSKSAILKYLKTAYPTDDNTDNDNDDNNDDNYKGLKPNELYKMCVDRGLEVEKKKPTNYYIEILKDDDAANENWGDEDETEEVKPDYSKMKPKELYDLCKERELEVKPKEKAEVYIKALEESDTANNDEWEDDDTESIDDWLESEDDDEWEE